MMIRALVALLASAMLLQACGFKLRGQFNLPPGMEVVYVSTGQTVLQDELERSLQFSGARVVTDAAEAQSVVDIFDAVVEREVRTIDTRGRASSYDLNYVVRFRVRQPAGAVMLEDSVVRLSRNFTFDPEFVLEAEREEEELVEDMQRDAAQQIMRRIAAAGRM
jgi:LPS-assembly lipoprotein